MIIIDSAIFWSGSQCCVISRAVVDTLVSQHSWNWRLSKHFFFHWRHKKFLKSHVRIRSNPHTNMRELRGPRKTLMAAQTIIIGISEPMFSYYASKFPGSVRTPHNYSKMRVFSIFVWGLTRSDCTKKVTDRPRQAFVAKHMKLSAYQSSPTFNWRYIFFFSAVGRTWIRWACHHTLLMNQDVVLFCLSR